MADGLPDRDISRGTKWLLLVSSLVVIAIMVGEARSNLSAEWRRHQKEYHKLLLAKALDEANKETARSFNIALQQVVVPELGVTDRCVSCHTGIDNPHMADEKQPYRLHPGTFLKDHPVSRFGCAICHRGQGAAVNNADAKAVHAYWDYPMLPGKMVQASCGQCHDPKAMKGRGGDILARGARLFESSGCRACHKLGGRGGALGIALDDEGRRIIHQLPLTELKGEHTVWNWLAEHFRDPRGVVPTSQMRNPTLTEPEIEALTTYILSLSKLTIPEDYITPDKYEQKYEALRPGRPNGAELYRQFCFSCHESGTYSRWDKISGRFIPAIRGKALAASPAGYLRRNIELGRDGTQMPGWRKSGGGLSNSEIGALEAYIRGGVKPVEMTASAQGRGNAGRGRALFAQNCRGCHGSGGKGGVAPALGSATFLSVASDAFILSTIKNGRPDTAMPAFQRAGTAGLTDVELTDLLAYIRSMK
ncbi:MAG: c-type cytochrome [Armatimonadota bacterium]|nr:c-type cytochrome [Armatimonadota bacterium]